MLDAAGLILEAVFITFPASVKQHLLRNPNPKTADGGYRPMKRYHEHRWRKTIVANVCRRCWRPYRPPRQSNRKVGEPCHEHLPMDLVVLCARVLIQEFAWRQNAFVDPFLVFDTPPEDYERWELQAMSGAQEMLEMERDEIAGAAAQG